MSNMLKIVDISIEAIFESLAHISIIMTTSFFIFYIAKTYAKGNKKFFYFSVVLLIVFALVIFEGSSDYYTFVQNLTSSLLLTNIYAAFFALVNYFSKYIRYVFAVLSLIWIFFLALAYLYATTIVHKKSVNNEYVKKIYIEAGAAIERKNNLMLLEKVGDCNKYKQLQKKRIDLDKELLKNQLFLNILKKYDKSQQARS